MNPPHFIFNRFFIYALVYCYDTAGYLFTNHLNWRHPTEFNLNAIDLWIPFLPMTGWIYVSVYLMPFVAMICVREQKLIRAQIFSFLLAPTLAFMIFFIYPTCYPRPPLESGGVGNMALAMVYGLDAPSNAWPSLHVVYAFLTCYFVGLTHPRWGKVILLWAVGVSVSTLTTKQHYFNDVIAGLVFSYGVFRYALHRYAIPQSVSSITTGGAAKSQSSNNSTAG